VPFGIAQIGKAFRNEITPGNFIFRTREFEQMEIEYFVEEKEWEKHFDNWLKEMKTWLKDIGVKDKNLHYVDIPEDERAHYSKKTIDIEYDYPFGQKELYGLAYRTDFDLSQHQKHSGKDMSYRDPVSGKTYIPHVIEPTFGVDRTVLTVLLEAYEEIKGGRSTTKEAVKESEIVLRLPKALAPVKAAILPLSKKEPLQKLSDEIFNKISSVGNVQYDETGSIGKRYRRQDEIGTPYCITIDFDSLEDNSVTVRDRDTMEQERIKVEDLNNYLSEKFAS
jgi:glycyl-tRNA synthetase